MVAYSREEFKMTAAFSRRERRSLRSEDVRENGCHHSPGEELSLDKILWLRPVAL
jgi:hypothetical protein